jgi:1,4-dihydroxy-6-naphthoate synthase
MFYALTKGLISSPLVTVEHVIKSIQSLNDDAQQGTYEMSAISFGAYPTVADKYALMPCGACMGFKVGPRILAREAVTLADLKKMKIAVPGKKTTAFLVLQMVIPNVEPVVVPFNEIALTVADGRADAGLVISETQFTYEKLGLVKIIDLGEWWFEQSGLPLPLGGNIIRKDLPAKVKNEVIKIFQESIKYALTHREEAVKFAMKYARGMELDQALKFIGTYVNELTVDYGDTGREALRLLYQKGYELGALKTPVDVEFA